MDKSTVGSGQTLSTIYEWKIDNYPSYSNLANGTYIKSPTFEIKKSSWFLRLFPKGVDEESNEYVCVYLYTKMKNESMKAMFSISVFDSDKKQIAKCYDPEYRIFDCRGKGFNLIKGISIAKFVSITILCEIFTDDVTIDQTLLVRNSLKVQIFEPFQCYLDNARFSDVKFVIGEKTVFAHKIVLVANSAVFDAMFYHDMRENKESTVIIKDIKYEVFKELMRFIYTGKMNLSAGITIELLKASDKYGILKLKEICEVELCIKFSTNNVIQCLHLADKYNAQSLKKGAIDFIVSHGQEMIEQLDFDSLRHLHAELFKDIFRSFATQPNKKLKIN